MVTGVQNSLGATAYLKGSQLGSGTSESSFKKQLQGGLEGPSSNTSPAAGKKPAVVAGESRESLTAKPKTTQLETKADDQTLQTEQNRGSLLDIAV